MSENAATVTPDQTYYFGPDKTLKPADVPDAAYDLVAELDGDYLRDRAGHFQRVINAVRPPVVEGGAPYAVVREPGSSKDTALVIPLPYCNPIVPDVMDAGLVAKAVEAGESKAFDSNTWNNGEKHVFLFDMLKALGVRDSEGNTIPVVTVGADSQDYQPQLDGEQKKALRKGSLDVYVRAIEDILDHEGYGRVHAAGYSQGGSIAHSLVAEAGNIDIASAVLAEMPTYKKRPIDDLAFNYLANRPLPKGTPDNRSGIDSKEKWTADGPLSRKELEMVQNLSFATMAKTIALNGAWRAALALRHATMVPDLAAAVDKRGVFPLTIAWNGTSALTHDIEQKLFKPGSTSEPVLDMFRNARMLRAVKAIGHEAVGAPHLAGESPMYYALLMAQSVAWANT